VLDGDRHVVAISGPHGARTITLDGTAVEFAHVDVEGSTFAGELDGRYLTASVERLSDTVYVDGTLGSVALAIEPRLHQSAPDEAPGSLHAPLPGTVRGVAVSPGAAVASGDVLVVLEAMKMEHAIRAPHDGTVEEVYVHEGDQVESGAVLVIVARSDP
jgi:acetyl/propionyl-CoA carboxylase alpha subunit